MDHPFSSSNSRQSFEFSFVSPFYPDRPFLQTFPHWMMYQSLDKSIPPPEPIVDHGMPMAPNAQATFACLSPPRKASLVSLGDHSQEDLAYAVCRGMFFDEVPAEDPYYNFDTSFNDQQFIIRERAPSPEPQTQPEPVPEASIANTVHTWSWNTAIWDRDTLRTVPSDLPTILSSPTSSAVDSPSPVTPLAIDPLELFDPKDKIRPLRLSPLSDDGQSMGYLQGIDDGDDFGMDEQDDDYVPLRESSRKRKAVHQTPRPTRSSPQASTSQTTDSDFTPSSVSRPRKKAKEAFLCRIWGCKHVSKTPHELFKHRESHFPDRFRCPECHVKYTRSSSLSRHLKKTGGCRTSALVGRENTWGPNLSRFALHPPVWEQPGWLEKNALPMPK
ncbi:hypothetical protein BDN72DRAFT_875959 [Pluteus cervinus]|uniref:Uncharacterized protein n=1 Tax=Pluteus cervinus TaxID=181527 RepID=A0ACD3B610_9AGAR|nr:hypothetical protein BDN72DRAFT_875959 [Pluteus cervinus]